MVLNIDHIGIVVKSLNKAINDWNKFFGYTQYTQKVENTRQKVYVVFFKKEGSIPIKLLQPIDKSSPVYEFAKRGGGLHHICFMCNDVQQEVECLKQLGCRILINTEPGEAFENENIAFVFAKHGLNIELIDTKKRANIIQ